ncbi:MAG TPA: hypothetical protein DEB12_09780, partial [Porphyromonadaceae bacterium]|nr:hypothetical protein [Porphyromonadaceae bacterium]
MTIQLSKEDLLNAINHIDENPQLKSGRHSSTYDLIYEKKKYPPILVLSVANELKGGKEITLSDFKNKVDIPFKMLTDNGFDIKQKSLPMKPNLQEFIKVAEEQITGQGTTDSAKYYARENKGIKNGLNIEISFGTGRASAIPWIAFTGFSQIIKSGIYPVYLYYKDYKTLILAYGISESNPPLTNWSNPDSKQTLNEYFATN